MAIDRKTAAQFFNEIRAAILRRTKSYDTAYGPVPDVVMTGPASVLEDINNTRLRRVSLLLSLANSDEVTEEDLNEFVFNEGLVRPEGSQAVTTLTFSRTTPFDSAENGTIPRGTPVSSSVDESSGASATFVTTEARDKTSAVAVLDPDTNQTVYKVAVPAICLVRGTAGKVGPGRITRPLRPLVGYTSVTNEEGSQEGQNRYDNAQLIELYLLAVASRQLSVPHGSEFHIRDNFSGVIDANEVFGTDPLLTRSADDAGAVDTYIIGTSALATTENITFLGVGQKIYLSTPPLIQVLSVDFESSYVVDEDFEIVYDTSGVSGSTRARDAIRFLPSGPTALPAVGDVGSITYSYNSLIRTLQEDSEDREVQVHGRDMLFRQATKVIVYLNFNLKVRTGFTPSDIKSAAASTILTFIKSLRLGEPVEFSDIDVEVRKISGVDNLVPTRMTREALGDENAGIDIDGNEYADTDATKIIITLV